MHGVDEGGRNNRSPITKNNMGNLLLQKVPSMGENSSTKNARKAI
jgi:hypothetical protein